jgi:hypothetical protein
LTIGGDETAKAAQSCSLGCSIRAFHELQRLLKKTKDLKVCRVGFCEFDVSNQARTADA